jgi:hypothetical protein
VVTGFFVERDDDRFRASWAQVAEVDVDAEKLHLSCLAADLQPASIRGDELALVESVLDNQVLDMRRRVFVRVQDVLLKPRDGELGVSGVDASSGALARRFGLGFLSSPCGSRSSTSSRRSPSSPNCTRPTSPT